MSILDLSDEAYARLTKLVMHHQNSTYNLDIDYSDYDLTDPYSYLSIATNEYRILLDEEAPDYESLSILLEDTGDSNE